MVLLTRAPERILALRLAMSSVIRPWSVVLDAGCGSLGVLAIMAARLGARQVVAVDVGPLDVARALAEENGVADRIEFRQCDLADLPAIASFDVILGMIYYNEPRRDLRQQQLMGELATRLARPGTAFIPDTVRYTVARYDSAGSGPSEDTQQERWASTLGAAEAVSGISLDALREFPGADYGAVTDRLSPPRRRPSAPPAGAAGRDLTLLTGRELFAEISYADPVTAAAYPSSLALPVTAPGRLDTTIWRQELKYGDLLIRRTETAHRLAPPGRVQPGDTAILSTGGGWGDSIPAMRQPGATAPGPVDPHKWRIRRSPR
jgi:SAM-dependent methyltransferase